MSVSDCQPVPNTRSGEYVLPSGVALPFGAMIAKLKRDRLVSDLLQVGGWVGSVPQRG